MMKMEGKKIFQNTDQNVKVKLDSGASVNIMPTSVYRRSNPQLFDSNGAPQLDKFNKDLTNLVAYGGSIIEQIGVKPVACKWGKKHFVTNFHIVDAKNDPVLLGLSTENDPVLFGIEYIKIPRFCSTPTSEDLCQRDLPKAQE